MDEWQPLETIPRDGQKVQLLSPTEGIDIGYWYTFHDDFDPADISWTPEVGDDWTGGLSTRKGSGDYTHWRPIA